MSAAQHQLLSALVGSGKWFSQKHLCEIAGCSSGSASVLLREMVEAGVAQCMKPPPARAKERKIYAEAGLKPLDGATPLSLGGKKARAKTKPRHTRGFRAEARARKGRHSKHTARASAKPAPAASVDSVERIALTPAGEKAIEPRIALTNAGTLLLMDTGREIDRANSRAIIHFVRRLDAGDA
jgi:hypothetical protein